MTAYITHFKNEECFLFYLFIYIILINVSYFHYKIKKCALLICCFPVSYAQEFFVDASRKPEAVTVGLIFLSHSHNAVEVMQETS